MEDVSINTCTSKKIAIGSKWCIPEEGYHLPYEDMLVPGLPAPNLPQQRAIRRAMNSPFTLIQGPPGLKQIIIFNN